MILSDISRPLDHLFASVKFGPFKFSFLASELDEFSAVTIDSIRIPVKRYLSGHRLDLRLWGGRLQAAVSELMLYGSANENFNIVYLNPFIFYHGAHKNEASLSGNVLPTIDFLFYLNKKLKIYTSLLIDDLQVEKTSNVDLEPNEIGWLIGFNYVDIFQISGLTVNLEYTQIANRTYKTEDSTGTFIHRNQPLGHPLGNDFDHWQLGLSYWLNKSLWIKLNYSYTRNGEGSLYTPWDTPWLNYTLAEGYDEPFPTGIVEKTNRVKLGVSWYSNTWLRFLGSLSYSDVNNQHHSSGKTDSYWQGKFRAELNFNRIWKVKKSN